MLEKERYDFLNSQSNLVLIRGQAIDSKAINVTIVAGIVLGLEYNIIDCFFNNILIENLNYLYYLIGASSSLFFSSILLGIITIIESHKFCISDSVCSTDFNNENEFLKEMSLETRKWQQKTEEKIKSKENFLKFSFIAFLFGILFEMLIVGYIISYSFYS